MNKTKTLPIILILSLPLLAIFPLSAQDCAHRFVETRYDYRAERDILYAVAPRFNGEPDSLRLNLFKPVGDGETERPLIIWIHGGGFFGGGREELDSLCILYARRGYVAATISYRLGFFNPLFLGYPYTYDSTEVLRAGYRAMQDARAAIRFLKARHAADSSSLERVFAGGFSAGGITALHTTYFTDEGTKPADADSTTAVQRVFSQALRPDLGPVQGNDNLNGYDAAVDAVVSYFGGLFDTAFIGSPSDPAAFLYHQTGDPVVGCAYRPGLWGLPFNVSKDYPHLYGSCVIEERLQHLGFDAADARVLIHEGDEHGVHDFPLIDSLAAEFLSLRICGLPLATIGAPPAPPIIELFPNPAATQIRLRSHHGSAINMLRLFDLSGRLLEQRQIPPAPEAVLPVDVYDQGMYLLEVRTETGRQVLKWVKG